MTTPTITSLAPLLDRLFDHDEAARGDLRAAFADVTACRPVRMTKKNTSSRNPYTRRTAPPFSSSRDPGRLLYMLARSSRARAIVEFGTSFGISALHLAAALRDNGGGRLITSEFEPSKAARARENLREGGLIDLVEIREGDALKTLSADLPDQIDLVLLDGAKALYPDILDLVEDHLRPGAIIVADNADDSPDYLARVRAPGSGYMSTPFAEDVELSVRIS